MSERVELPQEPGCGAMSLGEAITLRRSRRRFSAESMSLTELGSLLHYSAGITQRPYGLRAAPSAGATYPIEVYAVVNNVVGLDRGVYRYLVADHALELVRKGDFASEMAGAALQERMMRQASVVLALTAVFARTQRSYHERGQRYIVLEAGHVAQNIYLVATSLGMGACAIGAFYDEEFNAVLGVDGKKESTLYLMAVGKV